MRISSEKKREVWNHFVASAFLYPYELPNGVTGPRLRSIYHVIWNDDDFWDDVVFRHNLLDMNPDELELNDSDTYDHCQGNFWGMIVQTLIERGKIK